MKARWRRVQPGHYEWGGFRIIEGHPGEWNVYQPGEYHPDDTYYLLRDAKAAVAGQVASRGVIAAILKARRL